MIVGDTMLLRTGRRWPREGMDMRSMMPRWVIGLLMVLAVGVACFAAGAWLFSPVTPDPLRAASGEGVSPVARQQIDDARSIDVSLTIEMPRPLLAPMSGMVTSIDCAPGSTLSSGTSSMSVNGVPIVSLATSVPLWRDLLAGDRGEDVRGLQEALALQGYDVTADGEMGWSTIAAAADLLGRNDEGGAGVSSVPAASFLWLPSPEVTVAGCLTGVSSRVDAGGEVFDLAETLTSAQVSSPPAGMVEGPRVLTVGDATAPVDADGRIADTDALSALARTAAFMAWRDGADRSQPIRGSLALAEQVTAYAVAPAAVYGLDGVSGCIRTQADTYPVTVLTSQLGQTLVSLETSDPAPSMVLIPPMETPPCRSS